jgi:hypothetical protein
MKKALFSFVAAALVGTALVSCGGNKGEKSAEAPAEEQKTEAVADANTIDVNGFTVVKPDDWKMNGPSGSYVNFYKVDADDNTVANLEISFKSEPLAKMEEYQAKRENVVKKDDVVIGGKTFIVYEETNPNCTSLFRACAGGETSIWVKLNAGTIDNPEVQALISSIKEK